MKEWLCQASEVRKVGIDPLVHTLQDASELMEGLESVDKMLVSSWAHNSPLLHQAGRMPALQSISHGREITPQVPIDVNLVDRVWGAERPAPPTAPLRVHPSEWAGEDVISKGAPFRW